MKNQLKEKERKINTKRRTKKSKNSCKIIWKSLEVKLKMRKN